MITISIFVTSLVLLGLLFLVKKRELAGSAVILQHTRNKADAMVIRMAERFERSIQNFFHIFSKKVIIKGLHKLTLVALRLVRTIERRLVRVTTLVRGRHDALSRHSNVTGYLEGITREGQKEQES